MAETFGQVVRALMKQKGVSGTELGKLLGLSRQAVSTLLSDRNSPTLTRIKEVAAALGVAPSYLIMSPEERALWDEKNATISPKAELLRLVEALPPDGLGMAIQALKAVSGGLRARDLAKHKKAEGQ